MNTMQATSPCCRARVYRFGERRRQCARCKRTWSIRPKRRGRKTLRVNAQDVLRRLQSGMSLRYLATRRRVGREWFRRRHAAGLALLLRCLPTPRVPLGKLITIIDGLWFSFRGKEYALYLVLLRSVHGRSAVVQDPVLLLGHESLPGWRQVLGALPLTVQGRIVALISDGLTGIECLARERGWVHQRCHFHLLAQLQHFRGRRNRFVSVRPLREWIYQTVRAILATRSERAVRARVTLLRRLLARPDCPRWLGRRTRGFLNHLEDFRAYRTFPFLRLPTTTNAAESVCNRLRSLLYRTRGFRTPDACHRWLVVFIRTLRPVRCNGASYQQK